MSDSKLRVLERRWRETGAVEDEAAYLRERVRVGDLTQERLELAAYCGHEGAERATGKAYAFVQDLADWLGRFRSSKSVWTEAMWVVATCLLPNWSGSLSSRRQIESGLNSVRQWLDAPPDRRRSMETELLMVQEELWKLAELSNARARGDSALPYFVHELITILFGGEFLGQERWTFPFDGLQAVVLDPVLCQKARQSLIEHFSKV